jgi:phosphocarrier protein FPr
MIDAGRVRLGASPTTKEEAIRMVAGLLADGGNVDPDYAGSMLGREKDSNWELRDGSWRGARRT